MHPLAIGQVGQSHHRRISGESLSPEAAAMTNSSVPIDCTGPSHSEAESEPTGGRNRPLRFHRRRSSRHCAETRPVEPGCRGTSRSCSGPWSFGPAPTLVENRDCATCSSPASTPEEHAEPHWPPRSACAGGSRSVGQGNPSGWGQTDAPGQALEQRSTQVTFESLNLVWKAAPGWVTCRRVAANGE